MIDMSVVDLFLHRQIGKFFNPLILGDKNAADHSEDGEVEVIIW